MRIFPPYAQLLKLQDEFDRQWGKACGGAPSKQVYRPELPDPPAFPESTQDDAPVPVETVPDSSADVDEEDDAQGTSSDTTSEEPPADEGSNVDSGEIAVNWLQHGRLTKLMTRTRRG